MSQPKWWNNGTMRIIVIGASVLLFAGGMIGEVRSLKSDVNWLKTAVFQIAIQQGIDVTKP